MIEKIQGMTMSKIWEVQYDFMPDRKEKLAF